LTAGKTRMEKLLMVARIFEYSLGFVTCCYKEGGLQKLNYFIKWVI